MQGVCSRGSSSPREARHKALRRSRSGLQLPFRGIAGVVRSGAPSVLLRARLLQLLHAASQLQQLKRQALVFRVGSLQCLGELVQLLRHTVQCGIGIRLLLLRPNDGVAQAVSVGRAAAQVGR